MHVGLRSLIVPVLVAGIIFVREGIEFDAILIGVAVWGVFVAGCVLIGSALAGIACAFVSARRARFSRPTRRSLTCSILLALLALFPLRTSWDTVEGPRTASGLTAAANAALLKIDLVDHPTVYYTETCCG